MLIYFSDFFNPDNFLSKLIEGSLGLILLIGICTSWRPKKPIEEVLKEKLGYSENQSKKLRGFIRCKQDTISFLQTRLDKAEKEKKQIQPLIEEKDKELVRQKNLLRSRERELHEMRSKRWGGR